MLLFTLFYSVIPYEAKYPIYLVCMFLTLPFIFILTKKWKRDGAIGELSYPIYISHTFLLVCMNTFPATKAIASGFTLTVVTLLVSIALNELVAKRVERIRQGRVQPAPAGIE
jgi:peptidoglycan/LPS O-acetylase OafA/YrhL